MIYLIPFISLYLLWIFFLAVMSLDKVYKAGKLHGLAKVLGIPVLIMGLIIDTFVNWAIMTFVFLEIPKELTVTSRLSRWWRTHPNSWRGKFARKLSNMLLDDFDDGDHLI